MQASDIDSIVSTEEHGVPCLPWPMDDLVPILSIETDKYFHPQTTVPRMLAILPCLREKHENLYVILQLLYSMPLRHRQH